MIATLIRRIVRFGPILFALGFLMPLASQSIVASGVTPPFGLTPLAAGLIIALMLGLPAQMRGRWV